MGTTSVRGEKSTADAQYRAAIRDFGLAARYFDKQKFDKAKKIFEKLVSGPVSEVALRAQVRLNLCEQKLRQSPRPPAAKTAEDYYNLGLVELNAGNFDLAIEYLSKADKMATGRDHIKYALAAAHARQGNAGVALEHLSAAIALRPDNRFHARRDQDFRSLAANPRFMQLLGL